MPSKTGPRRGVCPRCGRELQGYVEEGQTRAKFFCQTRSCPNFMTHIEPSQMPLMPRRVDSKLRVKRF